MIRNILLFVFLAPIALALGVGVVLLLIWILATVVSSFLPESKSDTLDDIIERIRPKNI